jgi:rRNA maturation protein Rpf1
VIGLTTGRETNQRLNSLIKELGISIPNSRITRRGKSSKEDLARRLLEGGFTHALIAYRWHGGPGRLDFFNVKPGGMEQVPPSVLLKSVTLRREYGSHETPRINAITYEQTSSTTRRFGHILSNILEIPEAESHHGIPYSLHLRDSGKGTEIVVKSLVSNHDLGPKLVISRLLWSLEG